MAIRRNRNNTNPIHPISNSGLSIESDAEVLNTASYIAWFTHNICKNMCQSEALLEFIYDLQKPRDRISIEQLVDKACNGEIEHLLIFLEMQDADEVCISSIQEIVAQGSRNLCQNIISEIAMTILSHEKYENLFYKMAASIFGIVPDNFPNQKRLLDLAEKLNLTGDEQVYIAFLFCINHDLNFDNLCSLSKGGNELRDTAIMLGMSNSRLRKLIGKEQSLCRTGIIDTPRRGSDIQMDISPSIDDYLSGFSETPYSASILPIASKRFSLESFPVSEEDRMLLLNALNDKNKVHCILHGAPGTGKTEFIKSIAESCNKKIYTLTFPEAIKNRTERMLALSTMSRSLNAETNIIVIDECDNMINTEITGFFGFVNTTESLGKEWLNTFLDSTKISTIWITNKTQGMHESLKRRFAVSLYFQPTNLKHRLTVWRSLSIEYGLLEFAESQKALQLIDAFAPSPSDIESILQMIRDIPCDDKIKRLEQMLLSQKTLRTGKVQKPKLEKIVDCYDPSAINISVSVDSLIASINSSVERKQNLAILFHGKPGTGKTELAKYLAEQTNHSLLLKRTSDILNAYVGGTEQKIAAMFAEAEQNERILLLDEATGLIKVIFPL